MTWTFSRPKTSKYLPTCCENRAASRYPPRPLFARIQSSIEVADVFHIAKHTFAVLRVHYFHRIAQRNDNLRVRVESLNFLAGISGAKIRSRSFSYSFLISSSGKTAQIIR